MGWACCLFGPACCLAESILASYPSIGVASWAWVYKLQSSGHRLSAQAWLALYRGIKTPQCRTISHKVNIYTSQGLWNPDASYVCEFYWQYLWFQASHSGSLLFTIELFWLSLCNRWAGTRVCPWGASAGQPATRPPTVAHSCEIFPPTTTLLPVMWVRPARNCSSQVGAASTQDFCFDPQEANDPCSWPETSCFVPELFKFGHQFISEYFLIFSQY